MQRFGVTMTYLGCTTKLESSTSMDHIPSTELGHSNSSTAFLDWGEPYRW